MKETDFRPFFVARENLDTFNSITWFLADALWMMELKVPAYLLLIPTIVSGLILLYIEKRIPVFWINIAINSWIFMNAFWMISDLSEMPELLTYSKMAFAVGVLSVGMAAVTSKSMRETFSHFKRFRSLKWAKDESRL